jgi:pimeloyl-ACP methyl ester carboxylesterase
MIPSSSSSHPATSPIAPSPFPPLAAVPASPYGTLAGELFLYGSGGRAAFESLPFPSPSRWKDEVATDPPSSSSVDHLSPNKCVLLGGLSDGLMPVPYTSPLNDACLRSDGWSLVQPVLSSSYLGFGHGSLARDTREIDELLSYLICHRGAEAFCIVGHSTGCQNAVHYLAHGHASLVDRVELVVLQAPVSDREHAAHDNPVQYQTNLELAQQMVQEGKAHEMMPRSAFWAPITAQRFVDLHDRGGADDYFSSDYTKEELEERLSHVGRVLSASTDNEALPDPSTNSATLTPTPSSGEPHRQRQRRRRRVLVAFSGSDEYVPSFVDSHRLATRLADAMNSGCPRPTLLPQQQEQDGSPASDEEASPTDAAAAKEVNGEVVAEVMYLPNANHNLSQGPDDIATFIGRVELLLRTVRPVD